MTRTDLAYRRSAAEGASGFGLLISLFDTLAGDLRRAAQAQRSNNIETRCREAKHALLVIAHLEQWVKSGPGGELSKQLIAFYSGLRRRMLEAQSRQSAEMLEQQMADVLKIREYWQELDLGCQPSGPEMGHPANGVPSGYASIHPERGHGTWSF